MDCSQCDLPAFHASAVATCQSFAPNVYKPLSVSNLGTKQIPLLHLVYGICTQRYGPQAREGRKTWLPKRYSEKTGHELTPAKYRVDVGGAEKEVHHLIGMILAQRAHFLPIWAQLGRAHQLEVAGAIAALLRGEPLDTDRLSRMQAEMLKGSGHLALRGAAEELRRGLEVSRQRCLQLGDHIRVMEARRHKALERIAQLDEACSQPAARAEAVLGQMNAMKDRQDEIRRAVPQVFAADGTLLRELPREFQIDSSDQGEAWERQARAQVQAFQQLESEVRRLREVRRQFQDERRAIAMERERIAALVRDGEALYDRLEEALLDFTMMQVELNTMSVFAVQTQREAQPALQEAELRDDYALQEGNYLDPQECALLKSVLAASVTARQMFLFMDPRLKYQDDTKVTCRLRKFLSAKPVLGCFQSLSDANLIQPGPHAKLGVFVINALTPGSYDQRHRVMVQHELEMMVKGMQEHGMDPTICCHSCGTTAPSGKPPQDAASDWIRDHNPPTALYALGRNVYHAKLGLMDYDGGGKVQGQILLPQCRECSKRQGAITAKVAAILEAIPRPTLESPLFDALARIRTELESDDPQDWQDYLRLVCNPMAAWNNASAWSRAASTLPRQALVVTGGAGSFTGIDEDLLKHLGRELGCHTCTDTPIQNDPYRNISWIADHQPPTALVARGLMELPQVVYPHCWDCSEKQSQSVATLCRLFEQCFGKTFKREWLQLIKDGAWRDMV